MKLAKSILKHKLTGTWVERDSSASSKTSVPSLYPLPNLSWLAQPVRGAGPRGRSLSAPGFPAFSAWFCWVHVLAECLSCCFWKRRGYKCNLAPLPLLAPLGWGDRRGPDEFTTAFQPHLPLLAARALARPGQPHACNALQPRWPR